MSGNAFDILGAASAGWRTAWVRCDARAVFGPWGVEPTVTVTRLAELDRAVRRPGLNPVKAANPLDAEGLEEDVCDAFEAAACNSGFLPRSASPRTRRIRVRRKSGH